MQGQWAYMIHQSVRLIVSYALRFVKLILQGSVFFMKKRKDGRWVKSKNINGKRVYFYSSETTERKAIRDIENQMLNYCDKEENGKTFQEVADEWEENHYKELQWQTSNRYKSLVSHLTEAFGTYYIKNITSKDVELFFNRLVQQKYSTKSLKDQMSITKMIFKYAVINEYINNNVTEYLRPPKGKPKVTRESLTDEEIKIIENNIFRDFGKLAYFLLYTGLRKGEALALTYGDIDFKNNIISVTKSIEHHNNTPHLKLPKTEAGIRNVPLLNNVKAILPKKYKNNDIVFSQNGNYMTSSYFNKNWQKYKKDSGIDVTPHQLRHTFATLLYEWNIDVKDSQTLLGHSDIATTRNIYTHVRKSRLEYTADIINKRLSSSCQNVQNA